MEKAKLYLKTIKQKKKILLRNMIRNAAEEKNKIKERN